MKFRLVYIVYLIILFLAGYIFYLNITYYIDFLKWSNFDVSEEFYLTLKSRRIYSFVIICFPLIGVFSKNKYGWIFITTYLYYILWSLIFFPTNEIGLKNLEDIIFFSVLGLFIISLIIIMNLKKTSNKYYKIENKNLIGTNLISFVIGFCIFILLFISENKYYLD